MPKGMSGDLKVPAARHRSDRDAGRSHVGGQSGTGQAFGAIAIQADFTDANMRSCKMTHANLRRAKWPCHLENADLRGCDLAGADLKGAILVGTKAGFATLDARHDGRAYRRAGRQAISELPERSKRFLAAHARWGRLGTRRPAADFLRLRFKVLEGIATRHIDGTDCAGRRVLRTGLTGARLQGAQLRRRSARVQAYRRGFEGCEP